MGEFLNPERGLCQICTNKDLERESIASVIQLHSEICKGSIASLLDIVEAPPEEDQSWKYIVLYSCLFMLTKYFIINMALAAKFRFFLV